MTRRNPIADRPFALYLLFLAAFAAGVLAERRGWLGGYSTHPPRDLGTTFEPFWETWNLVQENYVDRAAVQPQRMAQGAIEGMLASLGDVGHTTYLTPDEYKQMKAGLQGHLEGIGAVLSLPKRRPTIMQIIPNSPAEAAGLQPGDILMQVDGKDVSNLPVDRIVQMVRGPAGTDVSIRVTREGEAKPLDFRITRAAVDVPIVSWHALPAEPVAHLAIRSFGNQADAELRSALQQIRKQEIKGLVLDVRGNTGGLKDQAVAVTSEFLKEGNVFLEQDAQGNRTTVPVKTGGQATELPLVLLIDEGTASSAEILAGALQDHGRAKLVGMRTFGTGTVLQPFRLSDGSAVLLAVLEWLTPNGRQIWHHGIQPDMEVALPEGASLLIPEQEHDLNAGALAQSKDTQLLKALQVLKELLAQKPG